MEHDESVENGVRVTVIIRRDDWRLVEWRDGAGLLQRSWMTEDQIIEEGNGYAMVADPKVGLPYGFDFAQVPVRKFTAAELSAELRNRGIWTLEDVRNNPQAAVASLLTLAGLTYSSFLDKCADIESNGGSQP